MLTENEIRVLIVKRVMAACDRCNGHGCTVDGNTIRHPKLAEW